MKGTIIKPDGTETPIEFTGEPKLQQMQDVVGGNIELVSVTNAQDKRVHMVVNEEGLVNALPFNRTATEHYHRGWVVPSCKAHGTRYNMSDHAPIVGTVLLLEGVLT